jgi:hypothetical protein
MTKFISLRTMGGALLWVDPQRVEAVRRSARDIRTSEVFMASAPGGFFVADGAPEEIIQILEGDIQQVEAAPDTEAANREDAGRQDRPPES